ncbi:MAG: hypothetical protein ACI9I0_002561, partial [Rhodoferax sp.]
QGPPTACGLAATRVLSMFLDLKTHTVICDKCRRHVIVECVAVVLTELIYRSKP